MPFEDELKMTPAEISRLRNEQARIYADEIAKINASSGGVSPVSASSTTTSTKTKSSANSALYGSMVKEAQALKKSEKRLQDLIDKEGNSLREFDALTGEGGFYEEDPDVALMRALAEKMNNEPVGPYSNIAAQVAMVDDPNFAGVFDKAVNSRVNAARKHFSRMGSVSRMAQSSRDAQRQYRSRQRSQGDARLKGFQSELGRIQDALYKLRKTKDDRQWEQQRDARNQAGRERVAGIRGASGPKPPNRHPQQKAALAEYELLRRQVEKMGSLKSMVSKKISVPLAREFNMPEGITGRDAYNRAVGMRDKALERYNAYLKLGPDVTHVEAVVGRLGGPKKTGTAAIINPPTKP